MHTWISRKPCMGPPKIMFIIIEQKGKVTTDQGQSLPWVQPFIPSFPLTLLRKMAVIWEVWQALKFFSSLWAAFIKRNWKQRNWKWIVLTDFLVKGAVWQKGVWTEYGRSRMATSLIKRLGFLWKSQHEEHVRSIMAIETKLKEAGYSLKLWKIISYVLFVLQIFHGLYC